MALLAFMIQKVIVLKGNMTTRMSRVAVFILYFVFVPF